jgi:hypothetical protein
VWRGGGREEGGKTPKNNFEQISKILVEKQNVTIPRWVEKDGVFKNAFSRHVILAK